MVVSGKLALAVRLVDDRRDAVVDMGFTHGPCEASVVAEGCATLRMYQDQEEGQDNTVSVQDIQNYFMSEEDDVVAFMSTVLRSGLQDATCQDLCMDSVSYLQSVLGLLVSDRHGYACTSWSDDQCENYVPVSMEAMHNVARNMELGGAYDVPELDIDYESQEDENGAEATEQDEMVHEAPEISWAGSIKYDVPDMALYVAHIFGVYPVPPDQTESTPGSLIEGNEEGEKPPTFGQEVPEAQRKTWRQVVPTAEAWLTSALSSAPKSGDLLKAIMGKADSATLTSVRKLLLGMQKTLAELEIRAGTNRCKQDTLAYVMQLKDPNSGTFVRGETEKDRFIIRVCNKFWTDAYVQDPTYRYGTLVHEASHHWGTTDEVHQGAVAYGLAQVLGLAEASSKTALKNADNFMWLVYFLNLCAGKADSKAALIDDSKPSCALALVPENSGKVVKVRFECLRQVRAASLKFIKRDRTHAAPSRSFGTLAANRPGEVHNAGNFAVGRGVSLDLIYEENCNIWQASATWDGQAKTAQAVVLHSLRKTKGGSVIKPIAKPVQVKQQPAQSIQRPTAEVKKDASKKKVDKKQDVKQSRPTGRNAEKVDEAPYFRAAKVDAALYFGHSDTFLTHGDKKFKCCKHSGGVEEPKLVDVTDASRAPKKRTIFVMDKLGCGAMYGNHFHSYNNQKKMQKDPAVYDGTCIVSKIHFKGVTGLGESFLRKNRQVPSGIEDSFTDADCRDSVPGAMKRQVDGVSSFFGSNACCCAEDSQVMGRDLACSTSVGLKRFFNPQQLRGKGCWCSG